MTQTTPLRLFVCTDHQGYWPVGTASVVIAHDEESARALLLAALQERKLDRDAFTLQELPMAPAAHILRDGGY